MKYYKYGNGFDIYKVDEENNTWWWNKYKWWVSDKWNDNDMKHSTELTEEEAFLEIL